MNMKHNALYFFAVNDKMTFAGHLSGPFQDIQKM